MAPIIDNAWLANPGGGFRPTNERRAIYESRTRKSCVWVCRTCGAEAFSDDWEYPPSDVLHELDCPYRMSAFLG